MSSRFESRLGNAGRSRKTMSVGAGQPAMSEKEIQAYLVSRDTVRRIQRVSSLLHPLPGRGVDVIDRTGAGMRGIAPALGEQGSDSTMSQ